MRRVKAGAVSAGARERIPPGPSSATDPAIASGPVTPPRPLPWPAADEPRRCAALVQWLVRKRRPVLWLALAVGLAGVFFSARLYADLRSGFEELLPDSAPSVLAARTIAPKLHNVTHLSVVLEGQDGDALDRLADDLAAR